MDISVIVTAHDEAHLAGPTLRSAELAIESVLERGYKVERLIMLDNPTKACLSFFKQQYFDDWQITEVDYRDQGRVRNHAVNLASGKWVAFLDADDLWSENWLSESIKLLVRAEEKREKIIVHPEINWFFEASSTIFVNIADDDPLYDPYYYYFYNYYDALCVCPREAYLEAPFADRDLKRGFAFEDWQWNLEITDFGWRHQIAVDTIIFKRRRAGSQTLVASQSKAVFRDVSSLHIDNICKYHHD
jgi:glycosyltransferase involved in cell wall biosynthesis